VNEIVVLAPILLSGYFLATHSISPSSRFDLFAYVPIGIFASIGFVVFFQLILKSSPYSKMLHPITLSALITVFILAAVRIRAITEFRIQEFFVFLGTTFSLIFLLRYLGLVLLTPDSFAMLANASYFRDDIPVSYGSMQEVVKRGATLPILNGMANRDSYLVSLAPLMNVALFSQIAGSIYVFRKFLHRGRITALVTLTFLVSTYAMYQVQQNLFYMNTHTLVAGCVLSLSLLGLIWKNKNPSSAELALAGGIGVALSLSRPEGYLIFTVALIGIISITRLGIREILLICALPLLGIIIWLGTVILSFEKGDEALLILVSNLMLTAIALIFAAPFLSRHRKNFLTLSAIAATVAIILFGSRSPRQFGIGISICISNFWTYWGITLFVMGALSLFAATKFRSYPLAGFFGLMSINIYLFSVVAKMSDGENASLFAICRPGWSDSLNRSLIHLVGLMALSSIFVLSEKKTHDSISK
jgi:hypothetical protein